LAFPLGRRVGSADGHAPLGRYHRVYLPGARRDIANPNRNDFEHVPGLQLDNGFA
jgi:hypothetical protein